MNATVGQLIRRRMGERGLTGVELAKRSGLATSYISELANDEKKVVPAPHVLAVLSEHLGLSQAEFLMAWGYELPTTPVVSDPRLAEFAPLLDRLTERQARHMLDHIRFMLEPE